MNALKNLIPNFLLKFFLDPVKIQDTISDKWYYPCEKQALLYNKSHMLLIPPLRSMSWSISYARVHQPAIVLGYYTWQQFNSSQSYVIVLHWSSDFSENKVQEQHLISPSPNSPTLPKNNLFSLYLATEFCLREPWLCTWGHCITEKTKSGSTKPEWLELQFSVWV